MIPTIRYLLPVLFFVMNAAVFAADKSISVGNGDPKADPPSEWVSVGNEWMTVNGRKIKLRVRKNEHDSDWSGNSIVRFRKRDVEDGYKIIIDSLVYPDGSYIVEEMNAILNIIRERQINGVLFYTVFEGREIVEMYYIGQKKEKLYRPDGTLDPMYSYVRGDTAFWNLEYEPPE
ncbi:MAG: hypothetical protein J6T62_09865 [Fibrobacter sp.]|nr:hypothetical protein [Fibrobacter sp.]